MTPTKGAADAVNEAREILTRRHDALSHRRGELVTELADIDAELAEIKRIQQAMVPTPASPQIGGGRLGADERQRQVLTALAQHPEGMKVTDIAQEIGVSQPRASQLVKMLEQRNAVFRRGRDVHKAVPTP